MRVITVGSESYKTCCTYQGDLLALERAHLAGVDMNMSDYDRRTALHLAAAENHAASVKFLVETCKVSSST